MRQGGITEATLEEIKARIDLSDLISSYGVAVKSAGASKKACCPFHHEKTPSFHINESRGFYHCFGCGESGDAIKFVQKMEGLTFVEAVKKLAEQCGIKIEEAKADPEAEKRRRLHALLAELAQFYHRCLLKAKEGQLARDYLAKRALGDAIQEDYLIGYAPNGVSNILKWAEKYRYTPEELEAAGVIKGPSGPGDRGYHRFGGRLMFSIRDKRGRVVGFSGRQLVEQKNSGKYVNSPETLVFKKSNVLYGFDKASAAIVKDPHREVIVCEGQIDCIRLQTSGFPNAVAGQGTAFTETHVTMLKKAADQVALVYDDDGAGHKATIKSARLCLAAELPVRVVSLPGGDDPDSFLRTHPAEEFRAMLENAESIMAFQVRAERAKETNPDSVDATKRITRELLATIAQCPSAVLRASMTGEAAKLTGLPTAALQAELDEVVARGARAAVRVSRSADGGAEPVDGGSEEEDYENFEFQAANPEELAIPPSGKEMAFAEFLMANEYDAELDRMLGAHLPGEVFEHPFVRRFVEVWRSECVENKDLLQAFGATLNGVERKWFDSILLGGGRVQATERDQKDVFEEFVRILWQEHLKRIRGELPATGDVEADATRMRISMDLKRLSSARWAVVKEIVRGWRENAGR